MTNYDGDFLATLDPEVRALAEEQMRDGDQVDTERFGGERTVSLDALNLDGVVGAAPDIADEVVDRLSGDAPAGSSESPALLIVRDVLASLPDHLAETYALVYQERRTMRDAGEILGISSAAVLSRLGTVQKLVGKAVIAAGEDAL